MNHLQRACALEEEEVCTHYFGVNIAIGSFLARQFMEKLSHQQVLTLALKLKT
jgi:hypothetical protein